MSRGRPGFGLAAVVIIVAATAGTVAVAYVTHFSSPWVGVPVFTILALLAPFSRKFLDLFVERTQTALRRTLDQDKVLKSVPGYRRQVAQTTDRITLSIHPAIPLPADAPAGLSDEFPLYVRRDIDANVRTWLRSRTDGPCFVTLVGPAAAGKTRLLSEALRTELPTWQFLRPTGAQVNALVESGADLSHSVLWLNDLETFLTGDALRENSVKELLSGHHGAVVLAATIRIKERDRLLSTPAQTAKEMRLNSSTILQMAARWSGRITGTERAVWFEVSDAFSPDELDRTTELASADPRLKIALSIAHDDEICATLACEDTLVGRWRGDGYRYGQAIVTAAVVVRRCGHPEPIPGDMLAAVVLADLSPQGAAPDHVHWLAPALEWAQKPVIEGGQIAALTPVRTRPGVVDGYRVSDILLQDSHDHEYPDVGRILGNESIWSLVLNRGSPVAAAEIAISAYNANHVQIAREGWRRAAQKGDAEAARRLGLLFWEEEADGPTEKWLRKAIDLGSTTAMASLGRWLWYHDREQEAEAILSAAAQRGDLVAMQSLSHFLSFRGDLNDSEAWARRAAESQNVPAMANLAYMLTMRGAADEAEVWALKAAGLGYPGAMDTLGLLYEDRGQYDSAIVWLRQGAERAYAAVKANPRSMHPWPGEAADNGASNVMLRLGNMLLRTGYETEAETWYRRGAELGDGRSAAKVAVIAEARLAADEAAAWCRQAAILAEANLTRNESSIQAAYGLPGVESHVAIMLSYVRKLREEGREREAEDWQQRATRFHRSPLATQPTDNS